MGNFHETDSGLLIPDHGETAVIAVTNTRGCVDPRNPLRHLTHLTESEFIRHRAHEDDGEIRNPGAAIGMVITLLAAVPDLDPETAVKTVYNFEKSQGREFEMHQDEAHSASSTDGLGCAHFDKASDPANAIYYGVKSSRVRAVEEVVFNLASRGEIVVEDPILTGEHRESGLIVVKSQLKTVIPSTNNDVFFRIDRTRHEQSLRGLAAYAITQDINVTANQLITISRQQERTTLGLVAEGKPIFEASLNSKGNTIKRSGTIRPPRRPSYAS